jgi:general secretion pathway protein E
VADLDAAVAALTDFSPLPEGGSQYPLEYMDANSAIKLRESESEVIVGLADPDDASLRESLLTFHGKRVSFRKIDRAELSVFLGKRLSIEDPHSSRPSTKEDERILLDRLANDAPVVNLVNGLMVDAIRSGASDIHIESFSDNARVRFRVDGILRSAGNVPKDTFPAVSSRVKIMANLNIMERRLPQDGRFSVHLGGGSHDVRVSIVPIAEGESIVLRLLSAAGSARGLEDLGIGPAGVRVLRALSSARNGLLLAAGPTGSGKTTTLNALLKEIASESVKVVTIEDPVEYRLEGVDQIQTNERIGLTFETLLRRVLRQDPNVIMVGEIRDSATAELAVRAALTGHLVLSTLHTTDAVTVIPRLRDMGVAPYLLAAVLRGVVAQRLVRTVCGECAVRRKLRAAESDLFRRHGLAAKWTRQGKGCDACGGTGFRGRTCIAEAFSVDRSIEELVLRAGDTAALRRHLARKGHRDLMAAGLSKVVRGETTPMEVLRSVAG